MKKLIGFLIVAALVGCKCMSQIPTQIIPTGEFCSAILPDYRDQITVRDNCAIENIVQVPVPGTILDANNMLTNVVIAATDNSGNTSSINFDVLIYDTEPPVIIPDSSLLVDTPIDQSVLINAYHTYIGKEMHKAANGPDSIWVYSYLHDTSTWEVNPSLNADSIFDNMSMLTITGPGFDGTSMGTFVDPGSYVMPLDSSQVADLGFVHFATIKLGPEDMPLTIDAGQDQHEWYSESKVHYNYLNTGGLASMYKSERFGDFSYRIPTGPGGFNVKLYFAEIYWDNPGQRVFSVKIEDTEVLNNLDIFAVVGKYQPLIYDYTTTVGRDGWLDIEFWASEDLAKISGITIDKVPLLSIIN